MYLIYVKSSIKVFCPADVHSVKRVSEMLQIVMVNTILPPNILDSQRGKGRLKERGALAHNGGGGGGVKY